MSDRVDVAVIGAGVMGAATARALAHTGREVVVFERREVGNTFGSSHGTARIFRTSYPDPTFVQMATEARRLWDRLSDEFGRQLLSACPAINTGHAVTDVAQAVGLGPSGGRWLQEGEIREMFPSSRLAPGETAFLEPGAGIISADLALQAFIQGAVRRGACLRERSTVESVRSSGSGVEVIVDGAVVHARTAVVTAGPWAKDLLRASGIDLPVRPTRETVSHYRMPEGAVPILIDWNEPLRYCLPTPDGLLKGGEHIAGPQADPEGQRNIDEDSVERTTRWLGERFDQIAAPIRSENCFYTNTSDENFILARYGPIIVGSPCSGHGFKFAPLIGQRLAALASEV